MDLNKTFLSHPINVSHFKYWLHNRSACADNKNDEFLSSGPKQPRENFKWHCLDCDLILTSELQAQEHLSGKKHQNLVKNKAAYCNFPQSKIKLPQNISAFKNHLFVKKKLQKSLSPRNNGNSAVNINELIPPPARDNILETVIKSDRRNSLSGDLSIYRTPTGKYYCQLCDLTVNSQAQFLQHSESRKHKHKAGRSFRSK